MILKRYTPAKEIGAGWLGRTHLALQRRGGGVRRLVAIKEIHNTVRAENLFHRCRALAPIEHHNLNRIIELGFDKNRPLVVSDYVTGDALLGVLARSVRARRPVPMNLAVRLAADACAGLHAAHTAPAGAIIHGALHPANVMVSYDGCVKVVDAGLLDVERLRAKLDISAAHAHFLAPELLSSSTPPSVRVDVYSVAVLLYVMLTLRYPYDTHRSLQDVLQSKLQQQPIPLTARVDSVPPKLEQVILRALSRSPKRRPSSARALQHELEDILLLHGQATTLALSTFVRSIFGTRVHAKKQALAALLALPPGGMVEPDTIVDVISTDDVERLLSGYEPDPAAGEGIDQRVDQRGPPTLPDTTWRDQDSLVYDQDADTETDTDDRTLDEVNDEGNTAVIK